MDIFLSMSNYWLLGKKSGFSISYHLRISSAFLTDELP
nr:MAG TPA: hypothetical protein [Caudoviricetes sp.]